MTQTISKSKLKARMLQIFRDLEDSGDDMIVTDHGRPVLRITPYKQRDSLQELFSPFQGQVIYSEDVDTPTVEEWEEM